MVGYLPLRSGIQGEGGIQRVGRVGTYLPFRPGKQGKGEMQRVGRVPTTQVRDTVGGGRGYTGVKSGKRGGLAYFCSFNGVKIILVAVAPDSEK